MGTTEVEPKVINRTLEAAIQLRHAAAALYRVDKRLEVIAYFVPELCESDVIDLVYNDLDPAEMMQMSHDELIELINEKIETCGQAIDPALEVFQEVEGA